MSIFCFSSLATIYLDSCIYTFYLVLLPKAGTKFIFDTSWNLKRCYNSWIRKWNLTKTQPQERGKNQFKLFSLRREDQRQLVPCPTITTPLRVPWHIPIHSFPLPIVSILFCFYTFKEQFYKHTFFMEY